MITFNDNGSVTINPKISNWDLWGIQIAAEEEMVARGLGYLLERNAHKERKRQPTRKNAGSVPFSDVVV